MAYPSNRPNPASQMNERLLAARQAGVPFDVAWARAWSRIAWPQETIHRRDWKKALGATRDSWKNVYNNDIKRTEDAVSLLAEGPVAA